MEKFNLTGFEPRFLGTVVQSSSSASVCCYHFHIKLVILIIWQSNFSLDICQLSVTAWYSVCRRIHYIFFVNNCTFFALLTSVHQAYLSWLKLVAVHLSKEFLNVRLVFYRCIFAFKSTSVRETLVVKLVGSHFSEFPDLRVAQSSGYPG